MQLTAIYTALTAAVAVAALPGSQWGSGGGGNCANQQSQVCCDGEGVLSLLECAVQLLGADCTGQAYCCSTAAPIGAIIDITALNCLQL